MIGFSAYQVNLNQKEMLFKYKLKLDKTNENNFAYNK